MSQRAQDHKYGLTSARFLNMSITILSASVWLSSLTFGIYILCFYFGAYITNVAYQWNGLVPLHKEGAFLSNSSIGLHFIGGALMLLMGSVQFIGINEPRWPRFHRISGRLYVIAAIFASVGGLCFIVFRRCVGGLPMDLCFGLYGVMTLVSAIFAWYYAWKRQITAHREWSVRLYALATGSWLYRLEYGFWIAMTGGAAMTLDYKGAFDYFMNFGFFIPTAIVAETVLRVRKRRIKSVPLLILLGVVMWVATVIVVMGSIVLSKVWISGILIGLKLRPYESLVSIAFPFANNGTCARCA